MRQFPFSGWSVLFSLLLAIVQNQASTAMTDFYLDIVILSPNYVTADDVKQRALERCEGASVVLVAS